MGVNRVILLGNLGKDAEMRYTANQTAVATFSLATGERRKDSSGQWTEHTEWHNIVLFGKTAEALNQYLKKGKQVYVEGRIQTRKWQDKEGRDRWTTEIIAQNIQLIGSGTGQGKKIETVASSSAGEEMLETLPTADQVGRSTEVSFDDDDIPF
ncbi:MAG: single-stranded DNA-binding protein [Bdellovibrionota bacterium]|nr:MAG: single-stranded DNA-binding protein [Bdellovibrionota bacterium]